MVRRHQEHIPGSNPERGERVLADLMPIEDATAARRIRRLLRTIPEALRIRSEDDLLPVLANYPGFLDAAWRVAGPIVRTLDFERAADRLRGAALLRPVPTGVDFAPLRFRTLPHARAYTDVMHYAAPKVLLLAEIFDKTLVEPMARRRRAVPRRGRLPPTGSRGGIPRVAVPSIRRLRGARADLLEDIRVQHGHAFVPAYYRGLSNWFPLLGTLWAAVKPSVGIGPYVDRRRRLAQEAFRLVEDLPVQGIDVRAAGLTPSMAQDLRDLLSLYRLRTLPDLVIDTTLVKALLDGPELATWSFYSMASGASAMRPRARAVARRRTEVRPRRSLRRHG